MAAWRGSQHDLAMQEATAETVLGDFDDASFTHGGVTSRFFKRDGKFFVATDGPDGKLARVRDPLHLRRLSAAAVSDRLPGRPDAGARHRLGRAARGPGRPALVPSLPRPRSSHAGDPLHWTGIDQTWNFMCAECHSTELRKNYDAAAEHLRDHLGGDRRRLRGLPRSRLGPRRLGASGSRAGCPGARAATTGSRSASTSAQGVHWTIDPATGNARAQRAADRRDGARDLRHLPFAQRQDRRRLASRPAAPRHARAEPAGAGPVRGRRQDAGRGLQLRLVPPEQDVHAGRDLQRLPRAAFAAAARRGQRRLLPVPRAGEVRRRVASPSCGGLAGGGLPGLPHAGAHLHGGRPAPRSRLPHPAAGPLRALRRLQRLQRLPRRQGRRLGGGRGRALARAGAQGLPDLDRGVCRGPGRHRARPGRCCCSSRPRRARRRSRAPARFEMLAAHIRAPRRRAPRSRAWRMPTRWSGWRRCARCAGCRSRRAGRSRRACSTIRCAGSGSKRPRCWRRCRRISWRRRTGSGCRARVEDYVAAQRLNADRPEARVNLGNLYAQQGQSGAAEAEYLAARALDPEFVPTYVMLAQLYAGQSRDAEGERIVREALARMPDDAELHLTLGLNLVRQGRARKPCRSSRAPPSSTRPTRATPTSMASRSTRPGGPTRRSRCSRPARPAIRRIATRCSRWPRSTGTPAGSAAALSWADRLVALDPQARTLRDEIARRAGEQP